MSQLEPMGEDIRGVLIHVVPLKLQARLLSRNFGQMLVPLDVLLGAVWCPCLCCLAICLVSVSVFVLKFVDHTRY